MDSQKQQSNIVLSMILGAGLGMIACTMSFAIVGMISAFFWIEFFPKAISINDYVTVYLVQSPIRDGFIPGAIFGALFGFFWGAFDSRVSDFVLRLARRELDGYRVFRQAMRIIVLGSILLGALGVLLTTSLWQI